MTKKEKDTQMTFAEFLGIHAGLTESLSYQVGSPGFYDVVRLWNSFAQLFPEKCYDVILCMRGFPITAIRNDPAEIKKAINEVLNKQSSRDKLPLGSNMPREEEWNIIYRVLNERNVEEAIGVQKKEAPLDKALDKDYDKESQASQESSDKINIPEHVVKSNK